MAKKLSHPSRVRELKRLALLLGEASVLSHPSRVRELKQDVALREQGAYRRRTPPGCVN